MSDSDSDSDYNDQVATLISSFLEIFQSNVDRSTRIVSIVTSNPTTACAEALATSILSAATAHPRKVNSLVLSIIQIVPPVQTIRVYDFESNDPIFFDYLFRYYLADYLKDYLYETQLHKPKETEITPTNPTLAAALFSASAIKNGLLINTKASYHFLRQGLQLSGPVNQKREVVLALGACLQLSVAGEAMMERWLIRSDGQDAILKALNKLKDNNVIRAPGGIQLLDKTIEIVQKKFTLALSPAAAWDLLFKVSKRDRDGAGKAIENVQKKFTLALPWAAAWDLLFVP
ncbi:hypothetical protein BDQ12DRAFT_725839 [Crucibulum laeve]|uniref:Uncharacterized protein n=1 Tax=Crucibulum laeve TaxID=68775 RepID=A0A5C3M3A1_9AGAR|nr:hypothetical protein BDQ12DRAFT_725839 [Crucibulum laeve]